MHVEVATSVELDVIEAAVGRRDLILVTALLLEHVPFEADRLDREVLPGKKATVETRQSTNEPDPEGRTRTKPAPRLEVSVVMNLDIGSTKTLKGSPETNSMREYARRTR